MSASSHQHTPLCCVGVHCVCARMCVCVCMSVCIVMISRVSLVYLYIVSAHMCACMCALCVHVHRNVRVHVCINCVCVHCVYVCFHPYSPNQKGGVE